MAEVPDAELAELRAKAAERDAKDRAAEDYKKDMLKHKDEAAAKEKELADLRSKQGEAEKAKLTEQNQFKELYEKEQKEKLAAIEEKDKTVLTVDRYIKKGALETAALTAGLKKEALADLNLLGFDKLTVRKEGSEVKVLGIEELIKETQVSRPHWWGEVKVPQVNTNGGGGGTPADGKLTAAQMTELQKKDPAKYRLELKKIMENAKEAQKK